MAAASLDFSPPPREEEAAGAPGPLVLCRWQSNALRPVVSEHLFPLRTFCSKGMARVSGRGARTGTRNTGFTAAGPAASGAAALWEGKGSELEEGRAGSWGVWEGSRGQRTVQRRQEQRGDPGGPLAGRPRKSRLEYPWRPGVVLPGGR